MRKDAKLRREALVAAAADLFLERGYAVALEEVATRAGVGRGTLYRNFADREALAIAVFEQSLTAVEKIAAREDLDLREAMVSLERTGATPRAIYARIAEDLSRAETSERLLALGHRFSTALEPIVARAKQRGELRRDITVDDIFLALRMLGGLHPVLRVSPEREFEVQQALDLMIRGLSPPQ